MNVIEIRGLTKQFGKVMALDKIDLTVKEGEIYGFIGPNGAGKSTTIRVLLGLLKATAGSARLFDQDAWGQAVAIHKRIAYVPGEANLWPNLTGGEVIDLFLNLHGNINTSKRDVLIERFKLDPTKKCRTYSKGNRQKVSLIAAFATEAELFLLDEPTAGLDPLMERIFQDLLQEVKAEGKSVLLSSHILSEVEKVCDRVAIIRDGQIIEEGSLEELRHLTRSQLTIETKQPLFDLKSEPGIHDVLAVGKGWTFQIDAEYMDQFFKKASLYGIIKLESQPPRLEDLFMRHYRGEG